MSGLAAISSVAKGAGLEQAYDPATKALEVSRVTYDGKASVRVLDTGGATEINSLVMLPVKDFRNGVIEAEVAGRLAPGAAADARGFIGLAFRVQPDSKRYEAFYIRPTNGRADDQLRRNHATQYVSEPDYPWYRLRKENPGVYESYADMAAGEWTRLRIEVEGSRARLFVNGAPQAALIVNDLKLGADASGSVALWIGPGTDGYFSNVTVTPASN